jgi:PAS domain S-box-containing protein
MIESANPVALTMFGYNKRDLVGANISTIVPPPMSGMHDTYLRNFVETGVSVRLQWHTE